MQAMKVFKFCELSRKGEKICMNESMFNHGIMKHAHDFIEITYITKGHGLYSVNDVQHNIKAGDLVSVVQDDTHKFQPLSRDFAWINVIFLPEAVPKDCQVDIKASVIKGRGAEFKNIIQDMLYEYYSKKAGYEKILQNHFRSLLLKMLRPVNNCSEQNQYFTRDELLELVNSFFKDTSSYSKVSLKLLAEKAHVTPKYFSILFKRKVGLTLTEYTKMIRLETAAHMLCSSDSDVLSIMNYVGYKDSKYFYNEFKKRYGLTPGEYRKKFSV
jgi:AraC family L-rhamnose operon transcriptional activator RhaR